MGLYPRVEFMAVLEDGRKVKIVSEIDGYKPLAVEAYDEDGEEVPIPAAEEDGLYEEACQRAAEGMVTR